MVCSVLSAAMSLALGLYSAEGLALSATELEAERHGRLLELNREISQLQQTLAELGGQERGVLGELEQLEAQLRLRGGGQSPPAL